MRVLLRNALILSLVLSVALGVIIGVTYHDTNHWTYLFTNPDGSKCATPCILGITPSNTLRFADAKKFLASHPVLRGATYTEDTSEPSLLGIFHTELFDVNLVEHDDDQTTLGIFVNFHTNGPAIGEFLTILGSPDSLSIYQEWYEHKYPSITLYYTVRQQMQYYGGLVLFDNEGFNLHAKTDFIGLNAYLWGGVKNWRGFASYDSYLLP